MGSALERLVNLAFFFSATGGSPVTAERIRAEVAGYPFDQDDATFMRMFERDKDQLRRMGMAIDADERGNYVLDRAATFAAPVDLTAEETAALRTAATALLDDPSFPFAEDLRLALAKVSAEAWQPAAAASRLADEEPERQGVQVGVLSTATTECKRVTFPYTNSSGEAADHEVEPYGLFVHDGRWYLVGRDVDKDDVRTYAVTRMGEVVTNTAKPKTPDFARPADFRISRFLLLPFQYGEAAEEFEATLLFEPGLAWRAHALAGGRGTLSEEPGGRVRWRISARSLSRLLRFALENGPGVAVVEPAEAGATLESGLRAMVSAHA